MLHMGHPGNDDGFEVGDDGLECLGLGGWRSRQRPTDVSGSNLRLDRVLLDGLPVFRDPVDQLVSRRLELLGRHAFW